MKLYGYGVFFVGKYFPHVCVQSLQLYLTVASWAAALQAPLPMGFSRQEYQLISLINKNRVVQIIFV